MTLTPHTTHLLPLSAATADALADRARAVVRSLSAPGATSPDALCTTAAAARHDTHRLAVTGRDADELTAGLRAYLDGTTARGVSAGAARAAGPRVAFLFSGQGAQFLGMGHGLYRTAPTFRSVVDRCAEAARPFLSHPLQELLDPASGRGDAVHRLVAAALGTFSVSLALTALWRTWGIEPTAVLGFSSGEYTAACCAGVLSPEAAMRLLGTEASLAAQVTDGAMAMVTLDEAAARELLADGTEAVDVAAVVSEHEVSLSGEVEALTRLTGRLAADGVRVSWLPVPQGLHSPLQEPALDALAEAAATVTFAAPRIPLVSTVTGTVVEAAAVSDPGHWRRHMRGPVRFLDAIRTLDGLGSDTYVEAGPGRALVGLGARCLPGGGRQWLASLGRSTDGRGPMLDSLGRLYTAGAPVRWFGGVHPEGSGGR
ncbi:acyltransferase domain-containing protein [Streptomyces sp. NPDC005562]|uniref:acyltransferase domain-containing protein n=1 Tax=Streptomyces sp. NPDC005562 TaxID=3154890 RepID=UPI0033B77E7E